MVPTKLRVVMACERLAHLMLLGGGTRLSRGCHLPKAPRRFPATGAPPVTAVGCHPMELDAERFALGAAAAAPPMRACAVVGRRGSEAAGLCGGCDR